MLAKIPDCSLGANYDQAPEELSPGAWSRVSNMRFRAGAAERCGGIAQVFAAPTATPYALHQFDTPTKRFWVEAGLATIYVDDGTTRTNVTPTVAPTGGIDDRWTIVSFSGYVIACNGKDKPWTWDGNIANKFVPMASWPATWIADAVVAFGAFLVALGVSKSGVKQPHTVAWSESAQPGQLPAAWTSTATNNAGERDLVSDGVLVDALTMGNTLMLYKEASIWSMTWIGGSEVMQTLQLPGNVGSMARGCGVDTPVGHVLLTNGDVVRHQGQGTRSIVEGRMRKWLFRSIDATNYRRAFLVANYKFNEVWICFPENGKAACTKALIWNWVDDTFGVRELANVTCGATGQIPAALVTNPTWATVTGTWDTTGAAWEGSEYLANDLRTMLGSAAAFGLIDTGSSDYGANITAVLERRGMHMGAPELVKHVKSLFPRFDGPSNTVVQTETGGAMAADQLAMFKAPRDFTMGVSQKTDSFASSRFPAVRFSSVGSGIWRLRSFDIDGRVGGKF